MWAMALGVVAALPSYAVIMLRPRTRVDETLDVLAAHGVAGLTGILFIGFVAQAAWNGVSDGLLYGNAAQLGDQALAVLAAPAYAFAATFALLKLIGLFSPLRVTARRGGARHGHRQPRRGGVRDGRGRDPRRAARDDRRGARAARARDGGRDVVLAFPPADVDSYNRDFWEQRWSQALRAHGDRVSQRPGNAHLTAEIGDLSPGRVLDAGCGHGSDTLWLATRGWEVTAVDFSATALAYGGSMAEAMGSDVAEQVDWVEADLATWTPQPDEYDLVVCLYLHVAGSVEEMVQRMAAGSLVAAPCSWLAIARWTRPPELRRRRPGRYRSPSRPRSPRSIRAAGSWSSPRIARGRGRYRRRRRDPRATPLLRAEKRRSTSG